MLTRGSQMVHAQNQMATRVTEPIQHKPTSPNPTTQTLPPGAPVWVPVLTEFRRHCTGIPALFHRHYVDYQ